MSEVMTVRIFLASPSADTAQARGVVVEAVAAVQDEPAYRHLRLDLLRWDNQRRRIVCDRSRNTQLDIEDQLGNPGRSDLVIGLFAATMGGTLPEDEPFGRPEPTRLWHCTEWEIAQGLRSLERRRKGERDGHTRGVWVFRDTRLPPDLMTWPVERQQAYLAEAQAVSRYIDRANQQGRPMREGKNFFATPTELDDLIRQGLREWLNLQFPLVPAERGDGDGREGGDRADTWLDDPLNPDQQALFDALCAEPEEMPESDAARLALAERVLHARVRGLRGYLLSRYAAWSDGAHRLDREFVNLDLLTDHGAGSAGLRMTTEQRYHELSALLEASGSARGWLLVGLPGGGKSTLLQHLEMSQSRRALRALRQGQPLPPLCVWQRLADCPHDTPDLSAWLAAQWAGRYPDLPSLDRLAQHGVRWRWLLDGVNEIQTPDADAHRAVVRRWAQWAAALVPARHAAPVFSVRTAENTTTLSTDAVTVRQIRVARWDEAQIERYCARRLGLDNALWPAIRGDDRDARARAQRIALASLPFNLSAQCQLFESLGRAVTARAELLSGLAWLRLRRADAKGDLEAPGLLGDEDRKLLADDVWWRDHLYHLPDQGRLVAGLDRQAAEMHRASGGTEISIVRGEIAPWLDEAARADWLTAVQRLELAGIDRDTRRFRYTHQLWQEFFAARGLRHRPSDRPEDRAAWQAPVPEDLDTVLRGLAAADPLPVPGVSAWEMALRMAVTLSDAPDAWIDAPAPVNLALAGRAAVEVRTRLSQACRTRLQDALLVRSRDPAVDIRLRIEAAETLGDLGDPRYEERKGPHGRYLWPKQWVTVPAGRYVIGIDDGWTFEGPATPVNLHEFSMAFAPVTNAEFRCFVEAGGYEDEQWWDGETANRWRREGLRNEENFEYWRPRIAALRQDFDAAVQRYFSGETQGYIEGELRKYAGWSEAEAAAELESSFGARVYRRPGSLERPLFDHAIQPVTELTLFEARAYARWLSAQTGELVRLPVEAEWEAAARRGTGRRWPWGETDPGCWQINADPTHLRRTSPVGLFKEGETPDGLTDMAGNVWEWTSSAYTDRLDGRKVKAEAPDGMARRVLRGGSWGNTAVNCRASYRSRNAPVSRYNILGLRLVLGPIQFPEP